MSLLHQSFADEGEFAVDELAAEAGAAGAGAAGGDYDDEEQSEAETEVGVEAA